VATDSGKKQRPVDPSPYDRDAYVVRICRNMRLNQPTKYAYFAGLFGGRVLEDGTLVDLLPENKSEKLKELPTGDSLVKVESELALRKEAEVAVAGAKYYQDTTADYIRRVIDDSHDLYVVQHKQELLNVLDQLAETNHDKLTMSDEEIESECLRLFKGWKGNTKFGLGYLFYLNRGSDSRRQGSWGDKVLTRIVKYFGNAVEQLSNEELVSTMLMVYLRSKRANENDLEAGGVDLCDTLDPTFLQHAVMEVIGKNSNSDAELCAIYLGLRRLPNFVVDVPDLREQIYVRMQRIALRLSNPSYDAPDADSMKVTNLAVVQSVVMLHTGIHFRRDQALTIKRTLEMFRDALIAYNRDLGFLLDASTAVKVATLGAQRGSLHDDVVTETVLERLHLGGQIKQLSLPYLVSILAFLSNARISGKLSDLTEKVVKNISLELSMISDENCTPFDVRMILQCWLHLAHFGHFDAGRLSAIIEEINLLHTDQDVVSAAAADSSSSSVDSHRIKLGQKLMEVCYQVLFPVSYAKAVLQQGNNGKSASGDAAEGAEEEVDTEDGFVHVTSTDRDKRDFVRLLVQLERTVVLFQPDLLTCRLDRDKLNCMVKMYQRQVPAVVYQSSLPAVTVTRRERLMAGALNGLKAALQRSEFVDIKHLLPHFRDPDIVFGHLAGMPMFLPLDWKGKEQEDFLRAPEVGDWVVVSVDGPSRVDMTPGDYNHGVIGKASEPDRYTQLLELGFDVHVINARDQKAILEGNNLKWAHRLLANVLTGNPQGDPNPRGNPTPVHKPSTLKPR